MSYLINYDYQNIIIMIIFVKGSGQILALPNRLESNYFRMPFFIILFIKKNLIIFLV